MKPFKLTYPDPSEREIHEAVADALEALLLKPAFWCAYPAGVTRLSPQQAAAHSRFGLKSGMPDIQIWYRGVYLIELKKPGGQLSRTRIVKSPKTGALREVVGQVERFRELRETGAVIDGAICYSVEGVLQKCAAWGIPMKGNSLVTQSATVTVRDECKSRNHNRPCIVTYAEDMVTVAGTGDCVEWCPILRRPVDEVIEAERAAA